MNVTYLVSDLGGGAGHHLIDLLSIRRSDSWDAEIISEVQSTSRMEIPVSHLVLDEPSGPGVYPFRQLQRYRQLATLLRRDRPDILHCYFFWSILYGRALKARGIIQRLVENREDLGFAWGAHEYALLALTRHLPDRVICVSNAVREVVLEREGLSSSQVQVIHNGITRSGPPEDPRLEELRQELDFADDNMVVGMVANYDRPVKGVRYFLESIPLIRQQVPEARFVLIGDGKRESDFRRYAKRLGIEDVFRMPGFREDVQRFYSLMDVSVLTSLSEGLSITVLESMLYGVPVVVTDVGGNREIVVNGSTGTIVPPKDPRLFADSVVRMLRDSQLRERYGANARRVIERKFDLRQVVRLYSNVYEELA